MIFIIHNDTLSKMNIKDKTTVLHRKFHSAHPGKEQGKKSKELPEVKHHQKEDQVHLTLSENRLKGGPGTAHTE